MEQINDSPELREFEKETGFTFLRDFREQLDVPAPGPAGENVIQEQLILPAPGPAGEDEIQQKLNTRAPGPVDENEIETATAPPEAPPNEHTHTNADSHGPNAAEAEAVIGGNSHTTPLDTSSPDGTPNVTIGAATEEAPCGSDSNATTEGVESCCRRRTRT